MANFKVGETTYPVTASPDNELLQDLDPLLYNLIVYLPAQLQEHLGARWQTASQKARLPSAQQARIVSQVYPYPPEDSSVDAETSFPLLVVFRGAETPENQTDVLRNVNNEFTIQYILPPLDAAQKEQLYPFLKGVSSVVNRSLRSKSLFITPNKVVSVNTGQTRWESWQAETNQMFHTIIMSCNITERISNANVYQPLAGIDSDLLDASVDPSDPILINQVSIDTEEP